MFFLAEYLVRFNPVAVPITEKFQIRWYGLAYVAGFFVAYLLMCRLARRGIGVLKNKQEVGDFITYAALFGVMLGGRLGYMLLYTPQQFFANPLIFFNVQGGGMASHGGILGIMIFTFYWARTRKVPWPSTGDNIVTVAPLGLFFGRMANFINGELWGIKTDAAWGMKFPEEATQWLTTGNATSEQAAGLTMLLDQHIASAPQEALHDKIMFLARTNDAFAEGLRPLLTLRHPSQLYEGLTEGLLLFLILWFTRLKWKNSPYGTQVGLFFVLYAIFRIVCENFREPGGDRIMGLTEGQFYSTFMIVIGAGFLANAWRNRHKPVPEF